MPILEPSSYRPPPLLSNAHLQTALPTLFRKVTGVQYERVRIDTPDGDFIDSDFARVGSDKVVIILHGLEGSSDRAYVKGMVKAVNRAGLDAAAVNFRGCSGEINRTLRAYHSGDTDDLSLVIESVAASGTYTEAFLVGFSLGGNVVMKYLGERGNAVHPIISKGVGISVPCDLAASAMKISRPVNKIYLKRFLRMLHEKIKMKMALMPGELDDDGYELISSFKEFDDRYTAPMHGFKDADDYWTRSSCRQFLPGIRVPALLIAAGDDPFLARECYPTEEATANSRLTLEIPDHGGHVGFIRFGSQGEYWSETRTVEFLGE